MPTSKVTHSPGQTKEAARQGTSTSAATSAAAAAATAKTAAAAEAAAASKSTTAPPNSDETQAIQRRVDQLQQSTQDQLETINTRVQQAQTDNKTQFDNINHALEKIMASIIGTGPSTAAGPSSATSGSQATTAASTVEVLPHADNLAEQCDADRLETDSGSVYSGHSSVRQQHVRKLHDLPSFSGAPEDWGDFVAMFEQSTQAYGYSSLDNNIRLRRSLVGSAKEAVQSLLSDTNETAKVMEQLERRFGRPDLLVQAHLRRVRSIAAIPEYRQELIVPYASKIANTLAAIDKPKTKRFLLNPDLLEELVMKLPLSRRNEWGNFAAQLDDYPTMQDFSKWLDVLAKGVSFMTPAALLASTTDMPSTSTTTRTRTGSAPQTQSKQRERMLHATVNSGDCGVCGTAGHGTQSCNQFKRANVAGRWELVRTHKLCFSCLQRGHSSTNCAARKQCSIGGCLRAHHQLLHTNPFGHQSESMEPAQRFSQRAISRQTTAQPAATEAMEDAAGEVRERFQLGQSVDRDLTRMLFRVLPVQLTGPTGTVSTYALYDEGSSVSMIERSLADELQLDGPDTRLDLQWFGSRYASEESRIVSLGINGLGEGARRYRLNGVRTMRNLDLPRQSVDMTAIGLRHRQMCGLPIASYTRAIPQLLIGVDNAYLGVALRHVCGLPSGPLAAKTRLGWTICGSLRPPTMATTIERTMLATPAWLDALHQTVKHHFSLEGVGVYRTTGALESRDDRRARVIMETTTRAIGQRYETGLLWKEDSTLFPNSKLMALNRLYSLERKMGRDAEYADRYRTIIAGLVASGYARRLTAAEEAHTDGRIWYLPHFATQNPNKPAKLRVVFDAAACVGDVSLNSALMKGPDGNRSLVEVLHNFRIGAIGVCADIKEMFMRVRIRKEDIQAQRFLWRERTDQPVETFVMESMIFGAACSPSSAQFVKNRNADEHGIGQAEAVRLIKEAHYVDDFVASFGTADDAIRITRAVVDIHRKGGFELRGFVSNDASVVSAIGGEGADGDAALDMQLDSAAADKILGMYWCTREDAFMFRLTFSRVDAAVVDGTRVATKREILSAVMSIYDPFGILANFTIYGKLILQDIWRHGMQWDDRVPDDVHKNWCQWISRFDVCRAVRVPRCYGENIAHIPAQLHIFADSSQSAMAAVAYWRLAVGDNEWRISFVIGKSRVAPPKLVSVPRLELQAAVLAVRLNRHIRTTHRLNIGRTTYWTDSKTVVQWIRSNRSQFPPFVAHRLAEIWEESAVSEWRWVPTNLNPADDATRAIYPVRYAAVNRWIGGPDFLRLPESQWPEDPVETLCEEGTERGTPCSVHLVCTALKIPTVCLTNFGDFFRCIRSMAYALRLTKIIRTKEKLGGALRPSEIDEAEEYLVRAVQQEAFPEELAALRLEKGVPKDSTIRALLPFIDMKGVMRVNGRIDRAEKVAESTRQPMILPKGHHLTNIMVAWYHRRMRHQQQAAVIGEIRTKYWVPHLRATVKRIKSECMLCRLKSTMPVEPIMGQLPIDRVTPHVRPFTYTGVDYFGPLFVTVGRRREKRYVALFTCMTVRAVHLELAADLSTDAFILCLRNFINLRGTPKSIRSDNGTNFVGASRELREAIDLLDHVAIQNELGVNRIEWKFNCPSHPQAGGCWERLVQSVKRVLSVTVREVAPKVETLRSLLLEAANIVNSRPLTHLPVSSDEDEPLTPNHFLLGCPSSTQTPGDDDASLMCLRKQWRVAQALKNHFWKRWLVEYLPDLTRRAKGFDEHPELKVGSLVLIVDNLLPRGQWRRGRVTAVYPGMDGHVRCALVKTAEGELKRPVSKLAVLNVES